MYENEKNSSFFCYFVTITIQKKELFWVSLGQM